MDYHALAAQMLECMAFQKMPMEKQSQMSSGERGILSYLRYVKDGAFAGELSRDLGVTTGRIAVALKNLEKKGMIVRSTGEKDRRCVVVHITPKGVQTAEAFYDHVLETTQRMLERLGEQDAQEYVRIVKRIAEMCLTDAETAEQS